MEKIINKINRKHFLSLLFGIPLFSSLNHTTIKRVFIRAYHNPKQQNAEKIIKENPIAEFSFTHTNNIENFRLLLNIGKEKMYDEMCKQGKHPGWIIFFINDKIIAANRISRIRIIY